MLERADTTEVIDLNMLALPLYSVIDGTSAPKRELDPSAIMLFHHFDCEICRILEDEHEHNIKAYAERKGWELAETLIDEGLSAFKGEHLSRGKLGTFLRAADKGRYRGHALVIEQLDRLSRLGITETSDLLRRIVKAGLE